MFHTIERCHHIECTFGAQAIGHSILRNNLNTGVPMNLESFLSENTVNTIAKIID